MDTEEDRQQEAARVMQVCFDKYSPTKSNRSIAKGHNVLNYRTQERNPNDDTVQRIKKESQARAQKIEDKLRGSENQISRQPTQLLQNLGAYRNLRKNLKGELNQSVNDRSVNLDMNDSYVLQGSPEKSFFTTMTKKSASRLREKPGTGTQLPRRHNQPSNSLAQQMLRISKSRSKSKAGLDRDSTGGGLENSIKEMELNVSQVIAQKQTALQQNLSKFKEKMAQKRQEDEQKLIDVSNQNLQRSVAYLQAQSSPFQLTVNATPNMRKSLQSRSNPKQASFSPPSFKNEHVVRQSRPSFGVADHLNGFNESGIVDVSPERERSASSEHSMGNVAQMMSIPVPTDSLNLEEKLQTIQQFTNNILYLVTDCFKYSSGANILLHQQQVDELRFKLFGAFARLAQMEDEEEQSEQIINVFRNLMEDIAQKLEVFLDQEQHTSYYQIHTNMMKQVLQHLTLQLTKYEFLDSLPEIAKGLHDYRVSLAVAKLQSLHNQKSTYSSFAFFKILQDNNYDRKRVVDMLKQVIRRYVDKHESLSKKQFFASWKRKVDKQQKKMVKRYDMHLSVFRENLIKQAPSANFNNFKGLPIFQELVQDLMIQCLDLKNEDMVLIEVLFLNKDQNKACSFLLDVRGHSNNHINFKQHTLDLAQRSILNQVINDFFIPGKQLESIDVKKIQMHTKFNPQVDIPTQMSDLFKSQELNQLVCPVVSESLRHIKMVVRMTSTTSSLFEPLRCKQVQAMIDHISPSLVKGMSQFKQLCKQFTKFQDSLEANTGKSHVTDCMLGQYQVLNEACLDLACTSSLSTVFEVVEKAVLALLSEYTKVSIVQHDASCDVYRMVDNSEAYHNFLNQMTNPHHTTFGQIKTTPPLVTFVEIQNTALKQKMQEMGQLCLDQSCPLWIQILLETQDSLEVTGKSIKDIVLIPINQAHNLNLTDKSHLLAGDHSLDTLDNATSYAFDSATNRSAFLNQCSTGESQEIFLLQVERKLKTVEEQYQLDAHVNVEQMLRALRQLVQIAVQKIRLMINQEKENQRRASASACARVFSKYEQLNSARVKDLVFKQWMHKLKVQKARYEAQINLRQKPNDEQLIVETDAQLVNMYDSEFTENIENEAGDAHTQIKRRVLRTLNRRFQASNLQIQFDRFVFKAMADRSGQRLLSRGTSSCQVHYRRCLIHRLLCQRLRGVQIKYMGKFKQKIDRFQACKQALTRLTRLSERMGRRSAREAMASWQAWLRALQRSEQAANLEMLATGKRANVINGLSTLISQHSCQIFEPQLNDPSLEAPLFRTAEECLRGHAFKNLIEQIHSYILETTSTYPFADRDFDIEDVVINLQLPRGHNILLPEDTHSGSPLFAQFVIVQHDAVQDQQQQSVEPRSQLPTLGSGRLQGSTLEPGSGEYEKINRTFDSIEQVRQTAKRNIAAAASFEEEERSNFVSIENQKMFGQLLNFVTLEQDSLINVLYQSMSGFCLKNIGQDESLEEPLRQRAIPSHDLQGKYLMVVPVADQVNVTGSLELYLRARPDSETALNLESEEGCQYWIQTFQSFAEALGVSIKSLMLQLLNKIALSEALVSNELNAEMRSFLPGLVPVQISGETKNSVKFSEKVQDLTEFIRKAYRADKARLVFTPYKDEAVGLYIDDEAELAAVELEAALIGEMLSHAGCTAMTMPSSLVCTNPFKSHSRPELYHSVTGEGYEALKLQTIIRNSQVIAVIEIGWHTLQQAQLLHQNMIYLNKKDTKVQDMVQDAIDFCSFRLRLITTLMKQRVSYETLCHKRRALFTRWKRLTFLEQLAPSNYKDDNEHSLLGLDDTRHLLLSADPFSPERPKENDRKMAESDFIARRSRQVQSLLRSDISLQRAKLVPYKSQQREQSLAQLSLKNLKLTQHVQALSKVQQYQMTRRLNHQQLREAFAVWKHCLQAQRIAESAFEQMLDNHQRHSEQRFASACSILYRLDKTASYKAALECMIRRAIFTMHQEKIRMSKNQLHPNSSHFASASGLTEPAAYSTQIQERLDGDRRRLTEQTDKDMNFVNLMNLR